MKEKKIIITGASGFIGRFLVEEALKRGYEVWAGVRPTSDLSYLKRPGIHLLHLAYGNEEEMAKQLAELQAAEGTINYVIHNAGLTKTCDKSKFFEVNAENTHRFLRALTTSCRPDKFLLMSSLSSYGVGDEVNYTPIRLDAPQLPNTAYGKSKLKAENYVRSVQAFPYVIFRPTGVYGPGEKDYLMEIKSIQSGYDFTIGKVSQRLTFIYVKDLARVAFDALEKGNIRNKEYFIADGDVHTSEEFAHIIQTILHQKRLLRLAIPVPLVYMACCASEWIGKIRKKPMTLNTDKYQILKQRNWVCDVAPLQQELGFKAEYNLQRGLEECIAWYKQHNWI